MTETARSVKQLSKKKKKHLLIKKKKKEVKAKWVQNESEGVSAARIRKVGYLRSFPKKLQAWIFVMSGIQSQTFMLNF